MKETTQSYAGRLCRFQIKRVLGAAQSYCCASKTTIDIYQVLAVSKDLTYSGVFSAGHSAEPKVKAYGLETFYTSQDRGVIRRWAFK